MATIGLPPRFEPPAIVESYNTVEIYADGATFADRGEIMTGIYYVEREGADGITRYEVARIHFPRSKWMAGLSTVLARIKGWPG